ncbi:MAG: hypothetical protein GTN74_07325 [Proteobacteria bacterium]|nr:hypothetical protein [Pseudomonadota bacterium]NIS69487.1 hypothetical protein [Pseudomonadota bacterium]
MITEGKGKFLRLCELFLNAVNGILIIAIGVVIVCTIALLFNDVLAFIHDLKAEGIGTVLSSLLILWVLMELLENQVGFLRGHRFNVGVFVLVVIVAFIRKLMVASLKVDKMETLLLPIGTILVLSFVYFIIMRSESRDNR